MIIIEGLDATGKSTLAKAIQKNTGWFLKNTEGPEKSPQEILERAHRYLEMSPHTIFDRHPLISQYIYGSMANKTILPMYLLQELKKRRPFLIEASSENRGKHIIKSYDTYEHLQIVAKRRELSMLYQQFFHIHFPLRITYTFENLEQIVQAATSYARRLEDAERY